MPIAFSSTQYPSNPFREFLLHVAPCRLYDLSGLQRRRLTAAGSRRPAGHQPRIAGDRTQLEAEDLPQPVSEHRLAPVAQARPGRRRRRPQVQPDPPDEPTQAQFGSQHRRIQVQPGPSDEQTQTQLHPQHGRVQARRGPPRRRARRGKTLLTSTEFRPQRRRTSFSVARPRRQLGQKQAESLIRPG